METEKFFMQKALEQARIALENNEVPVGAIIVKNNKIVGRGYNQTISSNDPSAHAEIIALRDACRHFNNYRLASCAMFVTLEPCLMCTGALVHSRIERLVFAAKDDKSGVIVSNINSLDFRFLNHKISYSQGLLGIDSSALLKDFFSEKRN